MKKLISLIFLCVGCLEPYAPPASSGDINALVVDGYIDAAGSAFVKLSRTIPLNGKDAPTNESGASVTIESSDGEIFQLHEEDVGSYSATGLNVGMSSAYTLHIITIDDDDYRSNAVKIHPTPPVDSVYFTTDPTKGLEIRTDSHNDDPHGTGYYLFNAVETYEYHAAVFAHFKLVNHAPIERTAEEEVFACYRDERTPNIVASTHGFRDDRLTGVRLTTIPRTSPKISVRYSILMKQRSISEEEYTYQRLLLMTTEQQGSLFAQIPGTVTGNVRSTKDPDEIVVGYFSAYHVQERRLFIETFSQLPEGFYIRQIPSNCQPEQSCYLPGVDLPFPGACVSPSALSDAVGIVSIVKDGAGNPIAYVWAYAECSDCTMKGGTTKKPLFW